MPPGEAVPVDFFCIGAPRSGSTWLATCLDEHPGIAVSRPKEPDFFCRTIGLFKPYENPRHLADWGWYAACWEHARPGTLHGDFSVNLMHQTDSAPAAIERHVPEARFLVILRDPVARAYSHYWYHQGMSRHWGGVPETFAEAIRHDGLVWRSRYLPHLDVWFERFGRERFHIILDVDVRADSARVLRDAFAFLGVDDAFKPPSRDARIHATRRRRGLYGAAYKTATALRKVGLGPIIEAAKRLGAESTINRVDIQRKRPPPIDPEAAQRLRGRLMPEIEGLEAFLGRDLGEWKRQQDPEDAAATDGASELERQLRPPPAHGP